MYNFIPRGNRFALAFYQIEYYTRGMIYNIGYKVKHHRRSYSLIFFQLLGKACITLMFYIWNKEQWTDCEFFKNNRDPLSKNARLKGKIHDTIFSYDFCRTFFCTIFVVWTLLYTCTILSYDFGHVHTVLYKHEKINSILSKNG